MSQCQLFHLFTYLLAQVGQKVLHDLLRLIGGLIPMGSLSGTRYYSGCSVCRSTRLSILLPEIAFLLVDSDS